VRPDPPILARWRGCTRLIVATVLVVAVTSAGRASARGAPDAGPLEVEPGEIVLTGRDARQQLAVTLRDREGSPRDATREARISVEPPGLIAITPDGVVRPGRSGSGTIRVAAGGAVAQVRVSVRDPGRSRRPSFRDDVVPLLSKAGCNMGACHGNLSGKGGFRLSLRGEDPEFDYRALTRDQLGRRVDLVHPESSLIVRKPTGVVAHEGGRRFGRDSLECAALLDWIAAGAQDDGPAAARVTALSAFPADQVNAPGQLAQQLVVTATFADGRTRDVTRQASYDLSDPTRFEVSVDGRIVARGPGEAAVAVRYRDGRATSRLAFPADRPGFVWRGGEGEHPVDRAVYRKLRALRIHPSPAADDRVFMRRAYLDAIGRLPDPAELRAFLADSGPDRRGRLIDRLVERPEFADFWALKWADLLRNEEKTMGDKGAWVFHRWLRDQIDRDVPLDLMVRRIVTGVGSTWQNPPSSFYRTNREATTAAESVAQVFLGIRIQCARCHNHPFDVWTQDDYYGLAAFFSNVARKDLDAARKDSLDKHEINGDEIIYLAGPPGMNHPRTGVRLAPTVLHGRPGPGTHAEGENALLGLADWLTRDNRQFDRNLANRVWFHLLGRGIVEPVDDFRDSNPPSNPALLDAVTAQFIAGGRRLRPTVAWIMKSRAYQAGAVPDATNREDEANFSHASVRLLPAEVLLDAVCQVLEVPERFPRAPGTLRAAQLPGVGQDVPFLKTFGKPERLLTCECERSEAITLAQAFQMINGPTIRRKLDSNDNRIARLMGSGASERAILDDLYLAALSREPSPAESTAAEGYLHRSTDRRAAWEDIAWALLNSKEFLLRH
jgi:hypothetical protein